MRQLSFDSLFCAIYTYTAICRNRLENIYNVVQKAEGLDGVLAEAGVGGGGSAFLISAVTTKQFHLYDSFLGLPEPTPEDIRENFNESHFKPGLFSFPAKNIVRDLAMFGDRIKIHEGWFKDTLEEASDLRFAFVHLDVDLYKSYKECLAFFVPRIVPGGFLILDEYGFPQAPGCKRAVDEYFGDDNILQYEHWRENIQLTVRMPDDIARTIQRDT